MNPRHLILETSVLPTELRTLEINYNLNKIKLQASQNLITISHLTMNYLDKKDNKFLIETPLPHNFLAEKLLINCIIFNSETLEIIRKNLPVDAFYFKNHQQLYKTFIQMNNDKLPINMFSLITFLQDNDLLAKIGGIKVLLDLSNQAPTFSFLTQYIQIVKEKFLKRYLVRFGYKIINLGYITNTSLEMIVTEVEQELFYLTNEIYTKKAINTTQLLNELFFELKEKFLNPKLPGLASGFSKLDQLTQGFQKSDLIIIAGRPSTGKTALSLNIAINCLKISQLPVLICSLEMSKEQILYRVLSSETEIDQMSLKTGKIIQNDWKKINKVMKILSKLPLFLDDTSSLSIQELRSKIQSIFLEQSQIGLVIIDYLQLIKSDLKEGTRVQELSQITRYLKSLAKEFNIPIIALSQLSRNVENRIDKRPILSDLRESGSIEQDADLILMLYSSKILQNYQDKVLPTELIIAKQRNGPTGIVRLEFNQSHTLFTDFEKKI